ncbi:MAG: helix-turn-helix domain-containing protein [Thermoplasmata archaeon]
MSQAPRLTLTENQQQLLEKWSRGGSTPYRLVVRSKIVLLAAQGGSNRSIARRLRINPITVTRWRSRFRLLGIEGIRHEAPRLGSPPRVSKEVVRTILHKTLFERPPQPSRWSTRSLARAVGVSHSTVRRIWKAYDVRPSRSRVATLARDPRFHPKSIDVVGVYVNPPQRALAISLRDDEGPRAKKPTGRRAPPSPRSVSRGSPWMVDLVTTLNLLDNHELKGSAHRLLDREFLSFLHSVQRRRQGREQIRLFAVSAGGGTLVPLTRWLSRHTEFSAQVPVRNAPLQQIVVEWFGDPSSRQTADKPPASLPGLQTAVERWVRETNDQPRPFAWTRKQSGFERRR